MRRRAIAKIETRVVPGASDGLPDENAIRERRTVVRARASHREPVVVDSGQQHRLAKRVARNQLIRPDTADLYPHSEIRPGEGISMVTHLYSDSLELPPSYYLRATVSAVAFPLGKRLGEVLG